MKKIGLFLAAALSCAGFASCNDGADAEPIYSLITTVRVPAEGDDLPAAGFYFRRDNGEKLHPGDLSHVGGGYEAQDNDRVIVWFTLLEEPAAGFDYNIDVLGIDPIYKGPSKIATTEEELLASGTAPTGYRDGTFNLTSEWLTFYALYAAWNPADHAFALVVDRSGTTRYEETAEGYLNAEIRHDAGRETSGRDRGDYVSFDLSGIAAELEGKRGIILLLPTRDNGDRYLRLDLPAER